MFTDYKLIYSDDQAVTTTAASTNNIDMGAASLDIGFGTPVWLVVILTAAFTSTSNTLTVGLYHSATDSSYAAGWVLLPATATSALTARKVLFSGPLPGGLKRYSQLYYTCSTTLVNGTIWAGLLLHGQYLAAQVG